MSSGIYYPGEDGEDGCAIMMEDFSSADAAAGDMELGTMDGEADYAEGSAGNPFLYPGEKAESNKLADAHRCFTKAGRRVMAKMPSKWTCCCCCGISTVICGVCSLLILALVLFVIVELAIFFFHHKDLA
eukprot:CAMPEP_0114627032 /NCGR_PEP_ID=MMETSP0168-20121206/12087_1 /TAXON_ID=95228 ORGANISM="Vannella sp., Strain DIVA3 517/6/12" /NCGR_SAMPLE_ID=MMETSP0168 /ASSEMBLY_ACC=CAM_ASM_000044 /LENGTH=129 /DNA_ID=CAMNT_0001838353 /DNA_START=18 /DNA_END=404 /DNA_ORIENTATION=-